MFGHGYRALCVALLVSVSLIILPVESVNEQRVHVISESNASVILAGEWMVEFYAPWCPACKKFEPVWSEFGEWANELNVRVAKVDVTAESGLSGRFLVTALPTIYHIKDNVFRLYAGRRAMDDLMAFVKEEKWQEAEVVPWWRSPSSVIMVLLGTTFKVSMTLRDVHRMMIEDYGFPTWAAYSLFAVCTIAIGVIIGALIVFMADMVLGRQRSSKDAVEFSEQTSLIDSTEKSSDNQAADDDAAATSVMRRKKTTATD